MLRKSHFQIEVCKRVNLMYVYPPFKEEMGIYRFYDTSWLLVQVVAQQKTFTLTNDLKRM